MKYNDYTYLPRQATDVLLKLMDAERVEEHKGYPMYIPEVDLFWKPFRRGRMYTILAATSHYKTGLMTYVARRIALDLVGGDLSPGQTKAWPGLVFFCSWEDSVEKIISADIANVIQIDADDILDGKVDDAISQRIRIASLERNEMPLVLIGHSEIRPTSRPNLTLSDVRAAIYEVCNIAQLPPKAVFLDYLQRIKPESGRDRRLQMASNVERIKDLTFEIAAPFIVGCQSNRDAYFRDIKIPERYDAMETSNIEQTTDGMVSLYLPKMDINTYGEPQKLDWRYGAGDVFVTEDLALLKILKQKKGKTGMTFPLRINYQSNDIEVMEI